MLEKKKYFNANTHFAPPAADVKFFGQSLNAATRTPMELAQIKQPRIGLIGHIDDLHTNVELLNYLAERHPAWSMVVVGALNTTKSFRTSPAFIKWHS